MERRARLIHLPGGAAATTGLENTQRDRGRTRPPRGERRRDLRPGAGRKGGSPRPACANVRPRTPAQTVRAATTKGCSSGAGEMPRRAPHLTTDAAHGHGPLVRQHAAAARGRPGFLVQLFPTRVLGGRCLSRPPGLSKPTTARASPQCNKETVCASRSTQQHAATAAGPVQLEPSAQRTQAPSAASGLFESKTPLTQAPVRGVARRLPSMPVDGAEKRPAHESPRARRYFSPVPLKASRGRSRFR